MKAGAAVKSPPADVGDVRDGLHPRVGRPPGGGHGNPPQCSCWRINPMDRGAWRALVHRVSKHRTRLKRAGLQTEHTYLTNTLGKKNHQKTVPNIQLVGRHAEKHQ